MSSNWSKKEINTIITQLDDMRLPFEKETMVDCGTTVEVGEGGSGYVYDCFNRVNKKNAGVVKVVGFKEYVDLNSLAREIDVQKNLARKSNAVVKIYATACVKVWLDKESNVIKAEKLYDLKDESVDDNCLTLLFIRMEKLIPVISSDELGRIVVGRMELFDDSLDELCKLFYDVACALEVAHKRKILHGDIKLDNIFYDSQKHIYKIGDFGTAVQTEYGVAKVIGYTNGYAAPEVYNCKVKKYDATADIYSLGIAIYILRNRLVKPASNGYQANLSVQYSEDYELERPAINSGTKADERLYRLLCRMCSFRPQNRPQRMKEVIATLSAIMVRPWYGMQIRFSFLYAILGAYLILKNETNNGYMYGSNGLSDIGVLGIIAIIKSFTLRIRNHKLLRVLYMRKKIDLIYLLSILFLTYWVWYVSSYILTDMVWFWDGALTVMFRIVLVELIVFHIKDKYFGT